MSESTARYSALRRVGRGAMGKVYRAWDERGRTFVAIKVVDTEYYTSKECERRFRREIEALKRVSHRNVVQIFNQGKCSRGCYFTMEFVDGESLSKRLEKGPLSPREAAMMVAQLADGLAAVHEAGVVHRDIKPNNIIIDKQGTPKLVDFGLAAFTDTDMAQTGTGNIVGTHAYVPPELFDGEKSDQQSDLYQLGLVLYEMLSGVRALGKPNIADLITGRAFDELTPLEELMPSVDFELAGIVEALLARHRDERITSAGQLRDCLVDWLEKRSLPSPPRRRYESGKWRVLAAAGD